MAKYKSVKQDNGKHTIEKIPIFKLGQIRGFSYDRQWSERMLQVMQGRAEADYFPPVIVGHNGLSSELKEKEAAGFMRNFTVEYVGNDPDMPMGTVYCDFFDVPETVMNDITGMKYPYRSVEIWNERAEFSAVALLGGTEPFFKFPRLEVFSQETGKGEAYLIEDTDISFIDENKQGFFSELTAQLKSLITKQPTNTEKPKMDAEKFKATYGMTPEEAAAKAKLADEQTAELAKLKAEKGTLAVERFAEKMRGKSVAPAVIEKLSARVKSGADPEGDMAIFEEILESAASGTLIVPVAETGKHSNKPETTDPNDSEQLHNRISKYAEEHKVSYADAIIAVTNEIDKAQREA